MATSTIRIDDGLKRDAGKILDGIGMSLNGYVTLAMRQLVIQQRVPFVIMAPADVPNEQTRRALAEAEAKACGIIPDDGMAFTDAGEAMSWLEADE